MPVSWSRRKTVDAITGHIRPTSRPDVDNFLKTILDAINSIVIADDAQVVEVHATKKFGLAPKMLATIFPLDAAASNRPRQPESHPTPRASSHERDRCEAPAIRRQNEEPSNGKQYDD